MKGKSINLETKKQELFKKFCSLGWDSSISGLKTFDFLVKAGESMPKGSTLADLGAGQGRYKFFFEHCNYIAVDFGAGDIEWDYSALDIVGNISQLDFIKDNSVDFCLNTVVLEHLSEPSDFFAHVQRILKPGGKLFLYAPFYVEEHQIPYDFFRYSSYGLKYLCEKNNLIPVSITPSDNGCHGLMRIAHIALKNIITKPDQTSLKTSIEIFKNENNVLKKTWVVITSIIPEFFKYKSKKVYRKFLFNLAGYILGKFLVPLFDYFDENFKSNMSMPALWYLIAQKEGDLEVGPGLLTNKEDVVKSIICCPSCKSKIFFSEMARECVSCKRKFKYDNKQIIFD